MPHNWIHQAWGKQWEKRDIRTRSLTYKDSRRNEARTM